MGLLLKMLNKQRLSMMRLNFSIALRKILRSGLFAILMVSCVATRAHAWNKAGHMVMAAITYRDLKKNHPEVIDKVVSLLKKNPEFTTRWAPSLQNVAEEDRDQYLFMLAARWPDDIRGNLMFDRPNHHFVDFAFVPPGQPTSVMGVDPDPENILTSLKENQQILLNAAEDNDSEGKKAVALSWIFHQIGDIHQPLHTVSLFTTDYSSSEGDRGGTRFYIRPKDGAPTISLHKLWDDFILGSENFQTVRNRATELGLRQDLSRSSFAQLTKKDFNEWAQESFVLAKLVAYRKGTLKGSKDKNDGKLLPEDYLDQCQPVAQRQVVLAGYRLADFLVKTLGH
jgi:hypothetical protein